MTATVRASTAPAFVPSERDELLMLHHGDIRVTRLQTFDKKATRIAGTLTTAGQPVTGSQYDEVYKGMSQSLAHVQWAVATDVASPGLNDTYTVYARLGDNRVFNNFATIFSAKAQNDTYRADDGTGIWATGSGNIRVRFSVDSLPFSEDEWDVDDLTGRVAVPAPVLNILQFEADESFGHRPVMDEYNLRSNVLQSRLHKYQRLTTYETASRWIGIWRVRRRQRSLASRVRGLATDYRPSLQLWPRSPNPLRTVLQAYHPPSGAPEDERLAPPPYEQGELDASASRECAQPSRAPELKLTPFRGQTAAVRTCDIIRDRRFDASATAELQISSVPFQPRFTALYKLDYAFTFYLPGYSMTDGHHLVWGLGVYDGEMITWFAENFPDKKPWTPSSRSSPSFTQ